MVSHRCFSHAAARAFTWLSLVLLLAGPAAAGPSRGGKPAMCPSVDGRFWQDQLLTVRLASRLQSHVPLRNERIQVQVSGGVVLLSGNVSSRRQATTAVQVARRVDGVRCVQSFLQVGPPPVQVAAH